MADKNPGGVPPPSPLTEAGVHQDRRDFLRMVGVAGAATGLSFPLAARTTDAMDTLPRHPSAESPAAFAPVRVTVNGRAQVLRVDPRTTLLDALREHLHLTGTKKGCDHGQCGACTVHVNGRRVNAACRFAVMHEGDEITTIEGLGTPEHAAPDAGARSSSTTATSAATARRPDHVARSPC